MRAILPLLTVTQSYARDSHSYSRSQTHILKNSASKTKRRLLPSVDFALVLCRVPVTRRRPQNPLLVSLFAIGVDLGKNRKVAVVSCTTPFAQRRRRRQQQQRWGVNHFKVATLTATSLALARWRIRARPPRRTPKAGTAVRE